MWIIYFCRSIETLLYNAIDKKNKKNKKKIKINNK